MHISSRTSAGIGAGIVLVTAAATATTAFAAGTGTSNNGDRPAAAIAAAAPKAADATKDQAAPATQNKPAAPAKAPTKAAAKPATQPPQKPATVQYANNLDGWIAQARAILKADGDLVPSASAIKARALTESSGNPHAENHWDMNQALYGGTFGLMQTIPPTFAKWSLPGHKDIFNPVDSIIAGVRYANNRYGDFTKIAYTKAGY